MSLIKKIVFFNLDKFSSIKIDFRWQRVYFIRRRKGNALVKRQGFFFKALNPSNELSVLYNLRSFVLDMNFAFIYNPTALNEIEKVKRQILVCQLSLKFVFFFFPRL